jgi:hypothetical protein
MLEGITDEAFRLTPGVSRRKQTFSIRIKWTCSGDEPKSQQVRRGCFSAHPIATGPTWRAVFQENQKAFKNRRTLAAAGGSMTNQRSALRHRRPPSLRTPANVFAAAVFE